MLRMTVQSVRASDGAATVQIRYDSARMTVNGEPLAPFDVTARATQSETGQFQLATALTSTALADAGFGVGLQMQLQTRMTAFPAPARPRRRENGPPLQ